MSAAAILRLLTGGVLTWQCIAVLSNDLRSLTAAAAPGLADCIGGTTDQRLRHMSAELFEVLAGLRERLPDGAVVHRLAVTTTLADLRRAEHAGQDTAATARRIEVRNSVFDSMASLLYPRVRIRRGLDPIAAAEPDAGLGWLLVFAGDPEPAGRAGWTCLHRTAVLSLWRFQRD